MNLDHPLAAIANLPHLTDCEPNEQLVLLGVDSAGNISVHDRFPLTTLRPLDDAALTVTRWSNDVEGVIAVAYTNDAALNPAVLRGAIEASGRQPIHVLRAGTDRWRSYTCARPRCCPVAGNRYTAEAPAHGRFEPIPDREPRPHEWRRRQWEAWRTAIASPSNAGCESPEFLAMLAASLHDIPVRDALLAHSARTDSMSQARLTHVLIDLARHTPLAVGLPVHTCTAALLYLDGLTHESSAIVEAVLAIDEYSLARLLHNGLQMRAPASLLARSFAHFDPLDLLAA